MKKIEFSTFYWVLNVKNHEYSKQDLLEAINQSKSEDLKDTNSHLITDWKNSVNNKYKNIFIKLVRQSLIDLENDIVSHESAKGLNLKIEPIWFQKYKKGYTHSWHIHPNTDYFGVYFLDVPENTPVTEFLDASGEVHQVKAKEGDIIIFPSLVIHRSPIIESSIEKTIIAFHINLENHTKYH